MAYTASLVVNSVFGNKRIACYRVTADAASGAVATNQSVIEAVILSPQSMTTVGVRCFMNQNAALAASNGSVALSGAVSGDVMFVTVIGK